MADTRFRISDLYAMPDENVDPWHDARDAILQEVFGMHEHDIDMEAVLKAGAARLKVHRKMQAMTDDEGEFSAGVYVISLDDVPYAAFVGSGENEADYTSFLVTDENLHRQAIQIAEQYRRRPTNEVIVSTEFDLRSVRIADGVIASSPAGLRLVDTKFAGSDGTLLFDEKAFREALRNSTPDPVKANRDVEWILSHGADLVAAAIPEGVDRVVVNEPPKDTERGKVMWVAAVAGTDEGTYAIGVHAQSLGYDGIGWGGNVVSVRLGGPELFAGFAERYAPEEGAPAP